MGKLTDDERRAYEARIPTPTARWYRDALEERDLASRFDYVADLAAQTGMDLESAVAVAEVMGEDEDFDQLVTFLEDHGSL